jgi:hypothetical protein
MQSCPASNNITWNVFNWNIRGVNAETKYPVLRNKLEESGASIACLQETKKSSFDNSAIRKFAPRRFDHFVCVPSIGASGGLLVLWNSKFFVGTIRLQEYFGVAIDFVSTADGFAWTLVNVYGPCEDPRRSEFVNWLLSLDIPNQEYWLFVGDFNFYRSTENRNRDGANMNDIFTFNEIISHLGLVELPIKGRAFTWSNMQAVPLLEQLDWFFTTTNWTITYPNTQVHPLSRPVSDHIPCVVKITSKIPKADIFRFENYWIRRHGFFEVVANIWALVLAVLRRGYHTNSSY